jgi:predicted thioesterase
MPEFDVLEPGLTREQNLRVDETMTVAPTGVAVLGTPKMIELMEIAARDLVQPLLPNGFATVGYEVNVKHKAPALSGDEIRVFARLLEADGRKLQFEVRVTGPAGKIVGEGLHRRTVVPCR